VTAVIKGLRENLVGDVSLLEKSIASNEKCPDLDNARHGEAEAHNL